MIGEDFVPSSSLSGRAAFTAGKPDSAGHSALCVAPGFELFEELLYLLAEDLLALEQGVAHALHDRALLAQERLDLLPGLGEDLVRLFAYLGVSEKGTYR